MVTNSRKSRAAQTRSNAREDILHAARKIMIEEGYAAVTVRHVAAVAGAKAPLVQHYFPTVDELMLELYRWSAQQMAKRFAATLEPSADIDTLWTLNTDSSAVILALEFMALANHRKSIREEIARTHIRSRQMQSEVISRNRKRCFQTTGLGGLT